MLSRREALAGVTTAAAVAAALAPCRVIAGANNSSRALEPLPFDTVRFVTRSGAVYYGKSDIAGSDFCAKMVDLMVDVELADVHEVTRVEVSPDIYRHMRHGNLIDFMPADDDSGRIDRPFFLGRVVSVPGTGREIANENAREIEAEHARLRLTS